MELIYNEKDITEDVRIRRVEYECFLGEHADRLTLTIDSSDEATSGWGFAPGDTIRLKDPDTGKMFICRAVQNCFPASLISPVRAMVEDLETKRPPLLHSRKLRRSSKSQPLYRLPSMLIR